MIPTENQTNSGAHDAASAQTNLLVASGRLDPAIHETEIRLPDGQLLLISTALLLQQARTGLASPPAALPAAFAQADSESLLVPIVEERLEISKRTVPTGKVVLEKQVQHYDEQLDVPLAVRTFDIERIVRNQAIDAAPSIRQDGDTTIYPVVEEQLVLTKQLVLKEEILITRRDTERRDTRTVTLKRENFVVTRSTPDQA